MCAYPTLLKQAVLPPAPQRSLTIAPIRRISTRKKFPSRLPMRSRCIVPLGTVPSFYGEEAF